MKINDFSGNTLFIKFKGDRDGKPIYKKGSGCFTGSEKMR